MIVPKSSIETGAGAAISEGKKIRALTASKASKKIVTTSNGAIYWRKKFIIYKELNNINNNLKLNISTVINVKHKQSLNCRLENYCRAKFLLSLFNKQYYYCGFKCNSAKMSGGLSR